MPDGGHYNKYYPGHIIAMPPPITDGQVTYPKNDQGQPVVPETVDQYGKDVAAFLMWAAEPHMMDRKALGFRVILFLILLSGLLYYVKKKIWADVGGEVHGLQPELHKAGLSASHRSDDADGPPSRRPIFRVRACTARGP